jgi:hypothetical protein
MTRRSADAIRRWFDFGCGNAFNAPTALVELQTQGVAALLNILERREIAYLADEVGLGKTLQALGVVACQFDANPAARVLVITPRETVQDGWEKDEMRFRQHVLLPGGLDVPAMVRFERLRDWLVAPESFARKLGSVTLLRHTSFTRPMPTDRPWAQGMSDMGLGAIADCREDRAPRSDGDRSAYHRAFADAFNAWLRRSHLRFDLVVVDEAQCLRNLEDQQTNSVLRAMFFGRVDRWLFLSATPAHSGLHNIATVMNKYPGKTVLEDQLFAPGADPAALRERLRDYMIRRPRTFSVGNRVIHKREYRQVDDHSLALTCADPLSTLAIASVQKQLARVVKNNRFRMGYMASFESLLDSLRDLPSREPAGRPDESQGKSAVVGEGEQDNEVPMAEAKDAQQADDFDSEQAHGPERAHAPDARFISSMSRGFEAAFNSTLPHPKLDAVVRALASAAHGRRDGAEDDAPGGLKTVVFCRRISSVTEIRKRVVAHYLHSVEVRVARVWSMRLDWETGIDAAGPAHDDDELEGEPPMDGAGHAPDADDGNLLRRAQSAGHWLYRYRASFNDGQRHALFFEHNWFAMLCRAGGRTVEAAAAAIAPELWKASVLASTRGRRHYRRAQLRYLSWLCLVHDPLGVFGLDPCRATKWQAVLRPILGTVRHPQAHEEDAEAPSRKAALAPVAGPRELEERLDLLGFQSLWDAAARIGLALPGWRVDGVPNAEGLHWHKIVSTVLGQYMRLTDTLIDILCAEVSSGGSAAVLDRFVAWLGGPDIDARRLRAIWTDWVDHYKLIFSSNLTDVAKDPAQAASLETFGFLTNLGPVVEAVGGGRGHKTAIEQFNTPGMPWLIVGTDTIREGVNLHLFCDRTMHYGLPWTAGDMEQRIGRVDRYFGRIERELQKQKGEARLQVIYPFLKDTLERRQIETMQARQRDTEAVTEGDFLVHGAAGRALEVELDPSAPVASAAPAVATTGFGVERHLPPPRRRPGGAVGTAAR